jgi:hypothetical protein
LQPTALGVIDKAPRLKRNALYGPTGKDFGSLFIRAGWHLVVQQGSGGFVTLS